MFKKCLLSIGALIAVSASPAAAQTTFNFTNQTGTSTSYSTSWGGLGVNVSAFTFTGATEALEGANLFSPTFGTGANISASNQGIGVCTEGGSATGGSGECPQVDTNGSPNEAMLLDFSGAANVSLQSAVLNIVDGDDTLGIFGVAADGALDFLGFAGQTIAAGGAGFVSTPSGTNQYTLTLTPFLQGFSSYLFTSTRDTADGYRLKSLTVSAVPEIEVWAMLILGFGFIGMQMRRRSGLATVTA